MQTTVVCRCGGKFAVGPQLAGRRVACPRCGQPIDVPRGDRSTQAPLPPAVVACQCGGQFKANPALQGKTVPCPSCGRPIAIPMSSAGQTESGNPLDLSNDLLSFERSAPSVPRHPMPSPVMPSARTVRSRQSRRPLHLRPYLVVGSIAAVCVLLLVVGVAAYRFVTGSLSGDQLEWREHISQQGRFAVLFPRVLWTTTVAESTRRSDSGATPLTTEGVRLQMGLKAAVVTVNYQDVQQSVHEKLDQIARLTIGSNELVRQRYVYTGEHRGMEVVFKEPGTSYVFCRRHFCIRNRVYTLEWATVNHEPSEADVQKFFTSFRVRE